MNDDESTQLNLNNILYDNEWQNRINTKKLQTINIKSEWYTNLVYEKYYIRHFN